MAKISKVNLNGSICDIGSRAANVLFDDNKSVDETRVHSVAFTEEATGVKLELKDKDGGALCSDSIDLAKIDKAGVVVIDSEMKKDAATKKVISTNSPTSKAVADYIENELGDLVGAMVFKGGVSSTAALPTACKTGDTYIVQEAGTYAGKELKIGDMLIANKDKESGAVAADWTPVSPTPKVENEQATVGTDETTIAIIDGQEITIKNEFDDELDEDSENAVQNKVVKEELEKKAEIVEIATSAGAAKLTLAAIKDLKNPQFQYQGKDIQAIKISATECLWENIDDEGNLWQYKQTSSGLTATKKQIAFMNNKDGQTDNSEDFYSDFNHVKFGTSGGVYFDDYSDTSLYPTRVFIYADEDWDDDTQYMLNVYQDGFKNIKLEGIACPIWDNLAANKDYVDRQELWKTGTASPYTCKLTNADLFKDVNNNRRYMFKGQDVLYKSNPTATKAEFFFIKDNEIHTLTVENNKITEEISKLAQLNEIEVLKTGQEQKLVVKFVDSSTSPIVWNIGTYYDLADKKVKTYVNGSSDPMVLAPTLKLSETPSPNVIYLDDLTKKIYQWNPTTNEMADIPTGGDTLVQVTYADLVTLRNNEQLSPGTQYRITDFVTTTNGSFLSAGFPFDVVVTALAPNKLAEDATAMVHDGDTHFANSMIGRWELKYDLNNDTSKYTWAIASGKGVIYYMKDEFLNESYYDFKNIMYDGTSFTFGADSDESITGTCMANIIKPWNPGIGKYALNHVIMSPGCINNNIDFNCLDLSFGTGCSGNKIGAECGNIMLGDACLSNVLGNSCIDIELGSNCNLITIGNNVNTVFINDDSSLVRIGDLSTEVTISGQAMQVSIGNNNSVIDIRDSAADVTIGDFCQQLVLTELAQAKIGNSVYDLTTVANNNIEIGDNCSSVVLYEGANHIKLGNECGAISIAEYANNITFGNNCSDIITSNTWENVVFGNNCKSVKFIEQGRSAPPYDAGSLINIHVADSTRNVSFYLAVDAYSRDVLNLNIHKGFNESANVNYTIDCRRMTHTYEQYEVALDSNKTLHMWNDADLPVLLDYCDFRPFRSSTLYYTGNVVTYNGRLYQFTADHSPGPWNTSQVASISVRERIEHLYEVEKVLTAGLAALALRVDDLEDYIP